MIRIGITGQTGFLGSHLFNTLGLYPDRFIRIPFSDECFTDQDKLRSFVCQCDVIVHLAAVIRHPDPILLKEINIRLVYKLIEAMEVEEVAPYVLFSSSTQEALSNPYGESKRMGRLLFEHWAERNDASVTSLILPNLFGPFGRPEFNSFVATFCYRLTHGQTACIESDNTVFLLYVGTLCRFVVDKIPLVIQSAERITECIKVPHEIECSVSAMLEKLTYYKETYFDKGIIPSLKDCNDVNLFNTFRSYVDHLLKFPIRLTTHSDNRGVYVETIRTETGGQVASSTTLTGITRGNHYHTRKVERFTVLRGKALICLRKVGTSEVFSFTLDGNEPSYVDIPVWYVHNITNIGDEVLYTQFWVNEWYQATDSDTYVEPV